MKRILLSLICLTLPISGFAFNPVLEWSWTSSSVEPSALNVMGTPSVVDLNKDGVPDVVFGATPSTGGGAVEVGFLRALNGNDGSEIFTVTDSALRINTTCSVATGDIDLDGFPEIITCDTSGVRLIAFEHDGSFKWRSTNMDTNYWGAPAIAELDGNGGPEIIMGRQILDSNGSLLSTGSGGRANQGSTGPLSLVADVDLDGSPEIIAGNTAYSGIGNIEWQTSLPDGYNAVANFDADDEAEIVLVSGGRVWLLEHDGTVKWGPVAIPGGGAGGPPTIADYDNDDQPEIGVAGASRYAVFETDGTLKWAAVIQDGSSNRTGSSVFDFENDGAAEVVYSDETRLWVFSGTDGSVLFQTSLSSCTWHEYPFVADVDGDNRAEIVAVANNNCGFGPQRGVYVYGDSADSWVPTRQIWNQHTYHITNVNSDGSIPVQEENNWLVPGLNNFRLNTFAQPELTATPLDETNELGLDNEHIVTATIQGNPSQIGGIKVDFDVTGQNPTLESEGTCSPNADCTTDANGEVSFTYTVPVEPGSLGTDTITVTATIAETAESLEVTKTWVDTTPPVAECVPAVNPHGKRQPQAPGTGQNEDGFYQLLATDDVWPADTLEVFVADSGSGTVFGPLLVGDNIKYTEDADATPESKKMGSSNGKAGAIAAHIIGNGDASVTAVDASGNEAEPAYCLVSPPPK
jgi:hypothetical protein